MPPSPLAAGSADFGSNHRAKVHFGVDEVPLAWDAAGVGSGQFANRCGIHQDLTRPAPPHKFYRGRLKPVGPLSQTTSPATKVEAGLCVLICCCGVVEGVSWRYRMRHLLCHQEPDEGLQVRRVNTRQKT